MTPCWPGKQAPFSSKLCTAFRCASSPQNDCLIGTELCKSAQLGTAGESATSRHTDVVSFSPVQAPTLADCVLAGSTHLQGQFLGGLELADGFMKRLIWTRSPKLTPYWKAKQFLFDVHNYLMLWLVIPVHQAGMTNRLIKWRAQTIFTSFTHTVEVSPNSLSAVTQNVSHCVQSCCQGAGGVVWIRCRYPDTSVELSVGNLSHSQGEKKEKLEANALGAKHIAWIKGYFIRTCANKKATASLILF